MRFQFISVLLLARSISAQQSVIASETVLSDRRSNFIQTSIFGQKPINLNNVEDPITLPPIYRRIGFENDEPFQGLATFAHLDYNECTSSSANSTFDIGIVGHPFDLGVSYRPGARFGTNGARQGARRLSPAAGWE